MTQLVLLVLMFLTVTAAFRFIRTTPIARLSAAWQSSIWLGALLLIVLALTGRLGVLIPVIGAVLAAVIATLTRVLPALIPFIVQYLPYWRRWRQQQGDAQPGAGTGSTTSTVQSRHLRMHLDHATGDIGGEVLEGPYAGQPLHDLNLQQLAELYSIYGRSDPESAKLLGAYLERLYGDAWQNTDRGAGRSARDSGPSREEALDILGLKPGASRDEIIAAHRRLIQKLHPDRGGSDYLAAKINQAKDVLLGA